MAILFILLFIICAIVLLVSKREPLPTMDKLQKKVTADWQKLIDEALNSN